MQTTDEINERVVELKNAIKGKLDDVDAMLELGGLYLYMSMFDEANYLIGKAMKIRPDSKRGIQMTGAYYINVGKVEEAEKWLLRQPDYAPSLLLLASMYTEQERFDEALNALEKAAAIEPNDAEIHYLLGNAFDDCEKTEDAMNAYRKAVEIDPEHAAAHNSIGMLLADDEEWDEAISAFRKALNIDPYYSNAHVNLASAYVEHPQIPVADAEDEFKLALRFDNENTDALLGLGDICFNDDEFIRAIEYYETAARVETDSAEIMLRLGNAYLACKDYSEATDSLRRATTAACATAEAHFLLGRALLAKGEGFEAAVHFSKYIKLEPDGEFVEDAKDELNDLLADWPV